MSCACHLTAEMMPAQTPMGDASQAPRLLPPRHRPQPGPRHPRTRVPQRCQGKMRCRVRCQPPCQRDNGQQQEEPCRLVPDSEEPALVMWAWGMGAGTGLSDTGHIPP